MPSSTLPSILQKRHTPKQHLHTQTAPSSNPKQQFPAPCCQSRKSAPAPSPALPKQHQNQHPKLPKSTRSILQNCTRTSPAPQTAPQTAHPNNMCTTNCTPPSTQPSISQITFPSLLEVRTPRAFSYLGKKTTPSSENNSFLKKPTPKLLPPPPPPLLTPKTLPRLRPPQRLEPLAAASGTSPRASVSEVLRPVDTTGARHFAWGAPNWRYIYIYIILYIIYIYILYIYVYIYIYIFAASENGVRKIDISWHRNRKGGTPSLLEPLRSQLAVDGRVSGNKKLRLWTDLKK